MLNHICLAMIVKDEVEIIEACLQSVKPIISYWVIVDTGSTDGTQEKIKEVMKDIPGELHQEKWINFGHNRTQSLRYAQGKAEYTFVIDADDRIDIMPEFFDTKLDKDAYFLKINDGQQSHKRIHIFRSSDPWEYVGVLHEYAHCEGKKDIGYCKDIEYHPNFRKGNRSNRPAKEKYLNDAKILESALKEEPDNARHVFYLAQSYRDAGDHKNAYSYYQKRSQMGGWAEEVFYSLYQMGLLLERMGETAEKIVYSYLNAYQFRPVRAEPLYRLARFFRFRNEYALAFMFAEKAISLRIPNDLLLIENDVYEWKALDEYAVACSWVGNVKECFDANTKIIGNFPVVPMDERKRIKDNLQWAIERL